MLVAIHAVASIAALILGSVNLLQIKGTKIHKILGWAFIACMFTSAVSSFGIYNNKFSVIHILSLLVILWLSKAIYAVRFKPKNWSHLHASSIGATYIALIIAGAGVLVRKILLPGNSAAGYLASVFVAIICILLLNKMTDKYKAR
jgi:uncharacterized membrane protein